MTDNNNNNNNNHNSAPDSGQHPSGKPTATRTAAPEMLNPLSTAPQHPLAKSQQGLSGRVTAFAQATLAPDLPATKTVDDQKIVADEVVHSPLPDLFDRPANLSADVPYVSARDAVLDTKSGAELLGEQEGFIIGARGHLKLRLQPDGHMITIAKTSGGKGTDVIIPNLVDHEGSVVSIEIGGASYKASINYRRHVLKQQIVVLDPFNVLKSPSDSINLLDSFDPDAPTFMQDVKSFAYSLLRTPDGQKENSAYFERTPAGVLTAILLHVLTNPDVAPEDRNLIHVLKLVGSYGSVAWVHLMQSFASDTGRYEMLINRVGRYFLGKNGDGNETENKDSIVSTITSKFDFADDPNLTNLLNKSTFSLKDLRGRKTTIYIMMPDTEMYQALSGWLRGFLEQSFRAVPNIGDGGKSYAHQDRIVYMIDEFTQLGKLDCVANGMLTLRQKGITLWPVFQDIAKLNEVYGKDAASSFLGAASCVQVFNISEKQTLDYISEKAGKAVVYIPSIQHGVNFGANVGASWQQTITIGESLANTKGVSIADTEGMSVTEGLAQGITINNQTTQGTSYQKNVGQARNHAGRGPWFLQGLARPDSTQNSTGYSMGKNESTSQGVGISLTGSTGTSYNVARTITNSDSVTTTTSTSDAQSKGGSTGLSEGVSYNITYAPQIIQALDPAFIERQLMRDNQQMLLVRGRHKGQQLYLNLLERRVRFFEDVVLQARVNGPHVIGAPLLQTPLIPPTLAQPLAVTDAVDVKNFDPLIDLMPRRFVPVDPGTQDVQISLEDGTKTIPLARWLKKGGLRHDLEAVEKSVNASIAQATAWTKDADASLKTLDHALDEYESDLLDAHLKLNRREDAIDERLAQYQTDYALMQRYQDVLREDQAHEAIYADTEAQYKTYIEALMDLRTRWPEIAVPERPVELTSSGYFAPGDTVLNHYVEQAMVLAGNAKPPVFAESTYEAKPETEAHSDTGSPKASTKQDARPQANPKGKYQAKPDPKDQKPDYQTMALGSLQIKGLGDSFDANDILKTSTRKREWARLAGAFTLAAATLGVVADAQEDYRRIPSPIYGPEVSGFTAWWCTDRTGTIIARSCASEAQAIRNYQYNAPIYRARREANAQAELALTFGGIGLLGLATTFRHTRRALKLERQYHNLTKTRFKTCMEDQAARITAYEAAHAERLMQLNWLKRIAADQRARDEKLTNRDAQISAAWCALAKYRTGLNRLNDILEARRTELHNTFRLWHGWDRLAAQTRAITGAKPILVPRNDDTAASAKPAIGAQYDRVQRFAVNSRIGYSGPAPQPGI